MTVEKVMMCRPDYFTVSYEINPWMHVGLSNTQVAQNQWQNLYKLYQQIGLKIEVVSQHSDLPDMVFAADQGLIWKNKFILSNFRYPQRQPEPVHFISTLEKLELEIIRLPSHIFFEGEAEASWFGNRILMGIGFRSTPESVNVIQQITHSEVISLELVNPYFYHLDTCLFVINNETVCYYPQAFSTQSQIVLKELIPNPIILTESDSQNFAGNSVTISETNVVIPVGCQQLPQQLKQNGFSYHEVDVSEFKKSGGGIHCLTLCL